MAATDSLTRVMAALTQMAAFRGADVATQTLALFAVRALQEGVSPEDVIDACRRLEVLERRDGESAFPSLGTLLRVTRDVTKERAQAAIGLARRRALDAYVEVPAMSPHEAMAWVERLRRDVEGRRRAD